MLSIKFKRLVFGLLVISSSLFAKFESIPYQEVQKLETQEAAVIIDIRTPQEWKETGIVPNSKLITFFDDRGKYDVNAFMSEFSKYVPTKQTPFILVCRTASRTQLVGDFLNKEGYQKVYQLKGGILFGYKGMDFKTVKAP